MIRFIAQFADRFGVEAICRILGAADCGFITARGYRAARTRPPSARALSDALLGAEIGRLHAENYGVYGARKMHALMRRQGWVIGRDQTARLMRVQGLRGAARQAGIHHQARSCRRPARRPGQAAVHRRCAPAVVGG